MGTLAEHVLNIGHARNTGIWADVPFTPRSDARYGENYLRNGGKNDGKQFFAWGFRCAAYIETYGEEVYGKKENIDWSHNWIMDAAECLISNIEVERKKALDEKGRIQKERNEMSTSDLVALVYKDRK